MKKKILGQGILVSQKMIEKRVFVIRGKRVMLDRDLANLYGVQTRILNQAVRRNIERFPNDFMITLTREEIKDLSQFEISSKIKHAPNVFAFTREGIAMLSSVLRNKRAIQINIEIMRVFVHFQEVLLVHKDLAQKITELEWRMEKKDEEIQMIFAAIRKLMAPPAQRPKRKIGFHSD